MHLTPNGCVAPAGVGGISHLLLIYIKEFNKRI